MTTAIEVVIEGKRHLVGIEGLKDVAEVPEGTKLYWAFPSTTHTLVVKDPYESVKQSLVSAGWRVVIPGRPTYAPTIIEPGDSNVRPCEGR